MFNVQPPLNRPFGRYGEIGGVSDALILDTNQSTAEYSGGV